MKTIDPGVIHEFGSKSGAIIEELSTTSMVDDSFYLDKKINKNTNRKVLSHFKFFFILIKSILSSTSYTSLLSITIGIIFLPDIDFFCFKVFGLIISKHAFCQYVF